MVIEWDDNEDEFIFSSGRRAYAYAGIVGIGPANCPTYGCDGSFNWDPSDPEPNDLHADDMRELADMMIERWTKFKAGLPT